MFRFRAKLRKSFDAWFQKTFSHRIKKMVQQENFAYDQLLTDVTGFVVYNQIPGDYFEFGVYQGNTFKKIYHLLRQESRKVLREGSGEEAWHFKRFIAFDSFEGLPDTRSGDAPIQYGAGDFASTEDYFRSNLKQGGVDLEKVIIVPGWFDKSLTEEVKQKHKLKLASMIYVDCDLYESAVPVFSFITSLIGNGTVLMLDDFFRYKGDPKQGVQRAFNDWLAANPHITVSELTRCCGKRIAFICHV